MVGYNHTACHLLHSLLEADLKAQVFMQTLKNNLSSDKSSFQIFFLVQFNHIFQMENVSLFDPSTCILKKTDENSHSYISRLIKDGCPN